MIGVRATRQILGDTSPTLHEVRNTRFSDTVAKPYAEDAIRLPYGSLLPQGVDNLLVAGRCISADEEAMGQLRSSRSVPPRGRLRAPQRPSLCENASLPGSSMCHKYRKP
jgi:hypothetical protein